MTQLATSDLNSYTLSLIERSQKWFGSRRARAAERLQQHNLQLQRQNEIEEEAVRLMPKRMGKTLELPITGDYVIIEHITGIQVKAEAGSHSVIVNTPAKEYAVPCQSSHEAHTVRHNVAKAGDLLEQCSFHIS